MTFMIVKARAAFCRGCAFLLVAAAAMTASCGAFADEPNGSATPDDWKAKLFAGDERVALEEPANGAIVAIRPGVIAGYKSPEERGWDAPYNCSELKNGVKECSHPTPVAFRWTFKEGASGFSTLQLSETPDFAAPIEISAGQETSAEATNLDTGATYFWRVKLTGGENAQPVYSSARMFATASDLPRWYKVPDISNVRDLGGWNAMNGKRVKKGMLFRGTELDRNFSLTPESKEFMTKTLGIRSDIDLRGASEWGGAEDYGSPLGKEVAWLNYPIGCYEGIFNDKQKAYFRDIFKQLADESTYPAYIHCWGGADRTGTLCIMIKAILGVNDNDLCTDYEMTSFSVIGERCIQSDAFKKMRKELEAYGKEGDPFSVKFENYLISAGVTQDELNKIRELLLEDKPE